MPSEGEMFPRQPNTIIRDNQQVSSHFLSCRLIRSLQTVTRQHLKILSGLKQVFNAVLGHKKSKLCSQNLHLHALNHTRRQTWVQQSVN